MGQAEASERGRMRRNDTNHRDGFPRVVKDCHYQVLMENFVVQSSLFKSFSCGFKFLIN